MPRMQSPYYQLLSSTPEQDREALANTKSVALAVRDLCRELDLPGDAFRHVLSLHISQLQAIVGNAADLKDAARFKKINKLRSQADQSYHQMGRPLVGRQLPGFTDDGLDDLDDAELDALVASSTAAPVR